MIRSLAKPDVYIVVVDHDLTFIDSLSDIVTVFYGVPGAYGVSTVPQSVKEGIDICLSGFVPSENIRFRN